MAGDTERRESPSPGYATFDHLLTAIGQQTEAFRASFTDLKTTLLAENRATRELVETYRAETNRRLDALEAWRDTEEIADAYARGRWHVVLLVVRWLTQHWQVVWGLVALILGLTFAATGTSIGVVPLEQQP